MLLLTRQTRAMTLIVILETLMKNIIIHLGETALAIDMMTERNLLLIGNILTIHLILAETL